MFTFGSHTMFDAFFRFYDEVYVPDHSAPLNRWTHFLSNVAALVSCGGGVLLRSPDLFAFGVWCQLGPPYLGHILFEKTHRSIDQDWLFAAMGSWWTTLNIFAGRQRVSEPPGRRIETATKGRADEVELGSSDLLPVLRAHGRELHSFMALEPGLSTWTTPDGRGAVAYVDRGGRWVAAGSPLCAAEEVDAVTAAFADAARRAGRRAVFFGVSSEFAGALGSRWDTLAIGRAPVWLPAEWDRCVASSPKLRNRLRKAARSGLVPRRASAAELAPGMPLRAALEHLAAAWSAGHRMPPMGFMVTVEIFENLEERRIFVLEHEGELRAAAVCVPIYGRHGWLLEDLLTVDAPAGATEVLIHAVLRGLAAEGAELVSLGLVALAGLDGPEAAHHPLLTAALRASGVVTSWLYDFQGLYRFRAKLRPAAWEPVLLVTDGPIDAWSLRAVLMAFAQGWVPRFAVRALAWVVRSKLHQDHCLMCTAKRLVAA